MQATWPPHGAGGNPSPSPSSARRGGDEDDNAAPPTSFGSPPRAVERLGEGFSGAYYSATWPPRHGAASPRDGRVARGGKSIAQRDETCSSAATRTDSISSSTSNGLRRNLIAAPLSSTLSMA